ncbi:Serine carboxypeptidase 1 [Vitis vinifera]|uniref:Carboxypeptidase n=1 Tax=Vitis vinifera TaxID=29760 RepID=A0A438CS25_VITVI|nr:Serine carboxypeptidase 1 [Vitis vinifera]
MAMASFYLFSSSLCMLFSFVVFTEAAPKGSLITHLPGFNGIFPSKHYSGYVDIGGEPAKNLFYYFVVSERNPAKDPLVLWLNGGPGCSSFDGFVYEHGPFNFEAGKTPISLPTLHLNPYSWSKVSSMIYLDSPTGVGFSFSKNTWQYKTGDVQTASDTHEFLLRWFKEFPEFITNPFYVSGESYAGVYVPTLSAAIVKGIKSGAKPTINFKGYLVGNGVTDMEFDANALVHLHMGWALYQKARDNCGGNYYSNESKSCIEELNKIYNAISGLNQYDILEPCYHRPTKKGEETGNTTLPLSFKQLGATNRPLPVRTRMFGRAWPFRAPDDQVASVWLNDKGVRTAIHAQQKDVIGEWEICTGRLHYSSDSGKFSHENQPPVNCYGSGDHDMSVPFTGSEAWTRSLGYKIMDEWRAWISNNQVAGYTQGYEHGLTFLTIKGAGHTVPEYKPREALDFFGRWLEGKAI